MFVWGAVLEPRPAERLRGLLQSLFGARGQVAPARELVYGTEARDVPLDGEDPLALVLVFDLAQTPELEVQGRFVRELVARLAERPASSRFLVVVDGAGYAQRQTTGEVGRERLLERRRLWDSVLDAAAVAPLHLDLSRAAGDDLAAAEEALWSSRPEGAAR
jgi:hypothetical protein